MQHLSLRQQSKVGHLAHDPFDLDANMSQRLIGFAQSDSGTRHRIRAAVDKGRCGPMPSIFGLHAPDAIGGPSAAECVHWSALALPDQHGSNAPRWTLDKLPRLLRLVIHECGGKQKVAVECDCLLQLVSRG